MKTRHNKKRNTAFVYEALIVEATMSILKKQEDRQNTVLNIIKKHFKTGTDLRKDLECYQSLYENQNIDIDTGKRILRESRLQRNFINSKCLFEQQTNLIHDINKHLSSSVFNNFVPNYKTLATIAQIFSDKTSPKNQIILENTIIKSMSQKIQTANESPSDKLVYKAFVEKFNSKYKSHLLEEQKELLMHYVSSFTDNALELKIFLNEEIARLKTQLKNAKNIAEIKADTDMSNKTNQIVEKLEKFSTEDISDDLLFTIMKTQLLVKEIYSNGNSN
tara:strand:+ start:365 stop:1195 length:831 start_codon:yes stop_codon:yes gene_type:complete